MLFKKFQQLAQWIGFLAIAGFALYGVVTLGSGRAWAVGNAAPSAITIPSTFNYQGFLRDPQGNAITGTRKIKVSLWTAVTAGSELYTETFTGVSVRDGLFNVVMGSTQNMSPSYFQNVVPLFVGVSVDDGAELIPRQRIHPVPWALLSTSAQQAATANTLIANATVQGLTNVGSLKIDGGNHYIEKNNNEMRFWGPKSFGWVGKDQNRYLMTLNDTAGMTINGGLDVNGVMTVSGTRPVLIKRFTNKLINNATTDTGISTSQYECTVAGWLTYMDIDEIGAGEWRRMVFKNGTTGRWDLHIYSKVHGTTPNPPVWVDVLCFHKDMVTVQTDSGVAAASNAAPDVLLPDTSSETTGQ